MIKYHQGGVKMIMSILSNPIFTIAFWTGVFLLAVIIEVATADLVSVWFAGGAVVSLILAIFRVPFMVQVLVWVFVSGLLLVLFKVVFGKKLSSKQTRTNSDTLIGQEVMLMKKVTPHSLGEAKVRDVIWSIQADEEIEQGEYVIITEIQGNKLKAKKKEAK